MMSQQLLKLAFKSIASRTSNSKGRAQGQLKLAGCVRGQDTAKCRAIDKTVRKPEVRMIQSVKNFSPKLYSRRIVEPCFLHKRKIYARVTWTDQNIPASISKSVGFRDGKSRGVEKSLRRGVGQHRSAEQIRSVVCVGIADVTGITVVFAQSGCEGPPALQCNDGS